MTAGIENVAAFEAQLVAQVVDSLAMYMMENARFMAERLYAEFPKESNAYLLGVCNFWCDKAYPAYEILRGCTSTQSRYMFAICCMKLGKYGEAEKALEAEGTTVPNGAYGHFLLGRIAKLSNRHEKARTHFERCLLLNPMMWSAFEELCSIGAFESATTLLEMPEACTRPACTISTVAVPRAPASDAELDAVSAGATCEQRVSPDCMHSTISPQQQRTDSSMSLRFPQVPPRYSPTGASGSAQVDEEKELPQCSDQDSMTQVDPGTITVTPAAPMSMVGRNSSAGQVSVVQLLRSLGTGHRLLMQYKSAEAVEAFNLLPCQHHQTPWVLTQMGKAHFEMVNYNEARYFFEWSLEQDPNRVEGLEWYSTVLWHMKKEVCVLTNSRPSQPRAGGLFQVEISRLAHKALSLDRLCPQAWCVMGNCFSLQKEHETALRFFQRALQIDPHFTYAYTLCGHEYFANEDFDKALAYYRNAITRDPRHYNAWYGIGQIYYRQEKYEMAINNFKHALNINPRSSVLMCYLGMAYHKQGRSDEALRALSDAIRLDGQNPLARYEYASVLVQQDKLHEAVAELEKLKDMAPREASVYFQMGKVYKKLKKLDAAHIHFSHALDLKPTSTDQNLIKSAIEKLHVDDEEVDDEM